MDLKSLREDKLKIKTQEELADQLGVDISVIRQLEDHPNDSAESTIFAVARRIHEKFALDTDAIIDWGKTKNEPLVVKNTWKKADDTKKSLAEYLRSIPDISEDLKKSYLDDLNLIIEKSIVKPKIAIVGHSDTGKSTLINSLLGAEKMPASWTPTTSIAVYIKHISDRPAFIRENAWIFANKLGDETEWDESKLNDEEYCKSWKIAAGDADILRTYGIRQGTKHDKEAGSAVVFVDSPILNTCDIVDLPGYGTERKSDDAITFGLSKKVDVIIYLSQANAFMRGDEFDHLKQLISTLPIPEKKDGNTIPPLGNLFIVASQAQNVDHGNRQELKDILDKGCERLLTTIPDGYWEKREAASGYAYENNGADILRSRFFTYTTDISDLCSAFNESITSLVEALPSLIEAYGRDAIRDYVEKKLPQLNLQIGQYQGLLTDHEKYVSLLADISANEESRASDNDKRKEKILRAIQNSCVQSKTKFSQYISEVIDVDALTRSIKKSKIKNKKDDISGFVSKLQTSIQQQCGSILSEESKKISKEAKDYTDAFSKDANKSFEKVDIPSDYDAGWAFTSALSKIGMIGGLGALAYGAISGAVIMAGVSGVAGIGIGALAGVFALSPVFGQIGLACGLIISGAMGVVKLFGGGWEKSVAKKIVRQFEEGKFEEDFLSGINTFWKDTENAFYKASDAMEDEWNAYVEDLKVRVRNNNPDELKQDLAQLNALSDFFENIPV